MNADSVWRLGRYLLLVACVVARYMWAAAGLSILVDSLSIRIISGEKLLLVADLSVLVSEVERLGHELVPVATSSLPPIVCHWMSVGRWSLMKARLAWR